MQTQQRLAPQYRLLVFLVSIGFFMQGLDTTIINTALPAMAQNLNINPLQMHNVVISYVLAVAAFIPLSGWLADRFGIRHVYVAAIVIFSLSSLGCALSHNLNQLIGFRILQGIGGALLMPVGRLAMLKLIPREQFLAAMSMMSLAGLIGPLIGPSLGGWLVQYTSWHWIFLINIPMGILGVFVSFKAMPNLRELKVKAFDLSGFILLMLAMVGLALGIEQIADPNGHISFSLLLFVVGALASLYYVYHAHSHKNALFRAQLFQHQIYRLGVLGNFFIRLGANAIPFLVPLMLQVAFHMEPLMAGIMMTPMVVGSLFSKPMIRPIIQKTGYRTFLIANSILLGLCIASFALTTVDTPLWLRTVHFFIFGILNSLQFVSMNTLTLKDLPQQDASSGNSFLSMIMMLSMSIGVALASTLLNLFSGIFNGHETTLAFQLAFISLGTLNILSTWIFWKLPKNKMI
ncbi:multidrug transporter subunit MdtD [Acinetobacter rudis]|uniref:multidrug transporter subunit MdtD n=1 Tax=Acinetobacter rudis TaxID=632955 RepID=UPI0028107F07|nr:multidrug transporter subunit MdtD [Acinetobacter rudis]MDQ8952636.1 multidrug transporter subunit MdtD [Acinetobacter rudis]